MNQQFAKKFFGGDALGKTFQIAADRGEKRYDFQVVGVVRNTKYYDLRENFEPLAFYPEAQDDQAGYMDADDGAFRPGAGLGDQWSEGCDRTGGQRRLCRFPSVRSADQRRAFARTPAGDAVQFLWDPGGGAGDDRAVRGDRVYCGPADERDRDPDGAGSIAATGPRNGGGRGGELARRRRHDRRRAGGGGGKIGVDIVVWIEAVRSFDVGVGGSRIGGSGHRGELAAGEASGEAGADGGAADE